MFVYYSVLIWLSVFAMASVQLCVSKSATLGKKQKRLFHLLYLAITTAALCEWVGVGLQGTGSETRVLHIIVKVVELSVAPSISVWIAWVIEKRRAVLVYAFLIAHACLEGLSGLFGFIFTVDSQSNYSHAAFYGIYVAAYCLTALYCIWIVLRNMRRYQYSGLSYFFSMVMVMVLGIVIQLYNSEIRVIYFTLALTAVMLYVFALEMLYQTDALTQLINRRGYDNFIARNEKKCAIIFFDVDRFKEINDTYGHAYGDTVLHMIGKTIQHQYSRYGKCFRYGGDEFCVVLTKDPEQVERRNSAFLHAMERLREKEERLPYISIGYAAYDPECDSVEGCVAEADQMMYRYKAAHRAQYAAAQPAECAVHKM